MLLRSSRVVIKQAGGHLDDAIADPEDGGGVGGAAHKLRLGGARRVEQPLQPQVEGPRAGGALLHGRQHLRPPPPLAAGRTAGGAGGRSS